PRRLAASGLDQTLARIALASPIRASSNATLEIAWHTKLPGGPNGRGHRMTQRIDDTLFQPTQWFPRVAKYDDLRGWDTSLYLGPAEFYNNFGRFDVKLDVPGGWIVSGTGVLQNPEEVLTAKARERLSHVLESNDVITIVGNNETWYGWMDEGFNQYMNILSDADSRGTPPNLNGQGQSYGRTSGDENEAPMMWAANLAGPMYSFQTYSKTPLMLSMLGGIV